MKNTIELPTLLENISEENAAILKLLSKEEEFSKELREVKQHSRLCESEESMTLDPFKEPGTFHLGRIFLKISIDIDMYKGTFIKRGQRVVFIKQNHLELRDFMLLAATIKSPVVVLGEHDKLCTYINYTKGGYFGSGLGELRMSEVFAYKNCRYDRDKIYLPVHNNSNKGKA